MLACPASNCSSWIGTRRLAEHVPHRVRGTRAGAGASRADSRPRTERLARPRSSSIPCKCGPSGAASRPACSRISSISPRRQPVSSAPAIRSRISSPVRRFAGLSVPDAFVDELLCTRSRDLEGARNLALWRPPRAARVSPDIVPRQLRQPRVGLFNSSQASSSRCSSASDMRRWRPRSFFVGILSPRGWNGVALRRSRAIAQLQT